jgi:D-alanyl-lipoteichoic acid acyltransferase DltB (MBOAT superfamily)
VTFNSFVFVYFFLIVYALYLVLNHRGQNRMLLVASIIFYGWWDWRFLSLLFISIGIDYVCGLAMGKTTLSRNRKIYLVIALCGDLAILFFFKYFNFFIDTAAQFLTFLGFQVHPATLNIILPIGISFYTFQALSYTIDVYRQHTVPIRNLPDFCLYILFFPQLVAGPIERSTNLLPMILHQRTLSWERCRAGLSLIISGYFKKIVIADNLAPLVESILDTPGPVLLTGVNVLVGVYAFAFQIYGDFAGYSDIARGMAKLMGFELMLNFNRPYFAKNPSDFWRRWHISLSTWLRDYLYIPLGGNRQGTWGTYRNLMLTMTLGGLWHGAAIHYVLWGIFHGLLLCIYRPLAGLSQRRGETGCSHWMEGQFIKSVLSLASIVLMFHLTCYGWLLFRVSTWRRIGIMNDHLFTQFAPSSIHLPFVAALVYYVLPFLMYEILVEYRSRLHRPLPVWIDSLMHVYMLAMIFFHGVLEGAQFIYFQF